MSLWVQRTRGAQYPVAKMHMQQKGVRSAVETRAIEECLKLGTYASSAT